MQKDKAMKSIFIGYEGKEHSITAILDMKSFAYFFLQFCKGKEVAGR